MGCARMELKQLDAFLTVSEINNFTKAADKLGYAQSSITVQIQQLENELGVKLFERIGKKISLTNAGEKLIPYARKIISIYKDMKNEVTSVGEPSGSLTIGASESLAIFRLPGIIKEYRRLYSNVDISLRLLEGNELLYCLCDGSIDLAFSIGKKIDEEYLIPEITIPEPIHILAYVGHPLLKKSSITTKDLDKENIILTGKGCPYRAQFEGLLEKDKVRPRIVLETGSIHAIKEASISELGICVLPEIAVHKEIDDGKLLPLNIESLNFEIVSQLYYHKDKYISEAMREFLRISRELLVK